MKSLTQFLLIVTLLFAATALSAQGDDASPTRYSVSNYFHVAPGGHADYLAMEKAWKKIHLANIKADKYSFWTLNEIVLPSGTDAKYNYMTRTVVVGEEKLAALMDRSFFPEDLSTILTPEEIAIVNKTSDYRTHVKTEVATVSSIIPVKEGKQVGVLVCNYFDYPEGSNHRQHVATEDAIWKPVHAARAEAGEMLGWVLANKVMPWGAASEYHDYTVDVYEDMASFMKNRSPMPHFTKVHAGKDIDKLMEQTDAAATLLRTEVQVVLDNSTR